MAALTALVFTLSWWLGMYLAARDPRKPVLALAAVGLCGFAAVEAAVLPLTGIGVAATLASAVYTAVFGLLQYLGLRRLR